MTMQSFKLRHATGRTYAVKPTRLRSLLTGALALSMIVSVSAKTSSEEEKSPRKQIEASGAPVAKAIHATAQPAPITPDVNAGVQTFLTAFVTAMNAHDPDAFLRLQAEDCATVNRVGRFFRDRASVTPQIERLLKQGFKDAKFPPFRILLQRSLTSDLVILQAAWQSPSLDPPPAPQVSEMIVTFLLKRSGNVWLAEEVDSHDVEPLPIVPGQTVVKP
jgi:uncharacterized protein (TIGR02246 family)